MGYMACSSLFKPFLLKIQKNNAGTCKEFRLVMHNKRANCTLESTTSAAFGRFFLRKFFFDFLFRFFYSLLHFFYCFTCFFCCFFTCAHGAGFVPTSATCCSGFGCVSATCAGFCASTTACSMARQCNAPCTDQARNPKTCQYFFHIFFHNALLLRMFMKCR